MVASCTSAVFASGKSLLFNRLRVNRLFLRLCKLLKAWELALR